MFSSPKRLSRTARSDSRRGTRVLDNVPRDVTTCLSCRLTDGRSVVCSEEPALGVVLRNCCVPAVCFAENIKNGTKTNTPEIHNKDACRNADQFARDAQ